MIRPAALEPRQRTCPRSSPRDHHQDSDHPVCARPSTAAPARCGPISASPSPIAPSQVLGQSPGSERRPSFFHLQRVRTRIAAPPSQCAHALGLAVVRSGGRDSERARGSDGGRSRRLVSISHASSIRSALGDRPRLGSQTPEGSEGVRGACASLVSLSLFLFLFVCFRFLFLSILFAGIVVPFCRPQGSTAPHRASLEPVSATRGAKMRPPWCVRIGRTERGSGRMVTADGTLYGFDERLRDDRLTKVEMDRPVPAANYA
ncbi:hypothetical protein BC628DRAFT_1143335 [Trametes gibbosa]|nr:hypothetical protein BC628DRAFT_1143335 [Trametes gibbosa]